MGGHAKTRGKRIYDRDTLYNDKEPYGAMLHCLCLSRAYRRSTRKAKVLLIDLIYQHRGRNNGKLVLCPREKNLKDGFTVLDRAGLSEPSLLRYRLCHIGCRSSTGHW